MALAFLQAVAPTPDDEKWYDVITKFRKYASEFTDAYRTLQSININPAEFPDLADEQYDLLKRGVTIKSTIQSVTGAVDSAWNWLKNQFGFSSVGALGFPALIPIAAVIGAVGLLVKWVTDFTAFNTRYNYSRELLAKGYSPAQINSIIKGVAQNESLFNFGQTLPLVFIGGLALFAYLNRSKGR